MTQSPPIIITTEDFDRLERVLEQHALPEEVAEFLETEIARAQVVPPAQVPAGVVTMNSKVRYQDLETGVQREVQLLFPRNGEPVENAVSVLAPVGIALLGMSAGQSISYLMPGGKRRSLQILEVTYQPEEHAGVSQAVATG